MKITRTDFTIEWLVSKLKEYFHERNVQLQSWQLERETCGERLLSHIVALTLQWSSECKLPNSVVLKIPHFSNPLSRGDRYVNQWLPDIHTTECNFYRVFGRLALERSNESFAALDIFARQRKVFSSGTIEGVRLPTVYYTQPMSAKHGGVIIMENLGNDGRANLVNGLDISQVRSVVDTLAAIHAESLRRDPSEWVPLFERPKDHVLKLLKLVNDSDRSMTAEFFKYNPPEEFCSLLQKCLPYLTPRKLLKAKSETHIKFGLPAVLCHGDLWVGNLIFEQSTTMIFKRDTCLASRLLAIIDWQLAYAGNCMCSV